MAKNYYCLERCRVRTGAGGGAGGGGRGGRGRGGGGAMGAGLRDFILFFFHAVLEM